MPPSFLLFETGFAHLPPCGHFLSERLLRRSHLGEIFWNDRREMPALRLIIHASFLRGIFSAGYAPFYLKKDLTIATT